MIYAFAVVFAFGSLVGGYAAHEFSQAEILRLQTAIERGNMQAEADLKQAQAEAAHNAEKAANLTHQIELSHVQAIQTANALTDRVAAASRVYASRQNCTNAVSASASTVDAAQTASQPDFSNGLAEIVRRADQTAIYAQSCWQFVSANCGIAHDGALLPD